MVLSEKNNKQTSSSSPYSTRPGISLLTFWNAELELIYGRVYSSERLVFPQTHIIPDREATDMRIDSLSYHFSAADGRRHHQVKGFCCNRHPFQPSRLHLNSSGFRSQRDGRGPLSVVGIDSSRIPIGTRSRWSRYREHRCPYVLS